MTETPDPAKLEELITLLRRKQGTWVEWGQACATLQKSGYNSSQIFEETGFEPVQQNQVIVGSQVYTSIVKAEASEAVRSRFQQKGSDILYEFRILTQPQRVAAAEFVLTHNLDADEARELAKAIKEFSPMQSQGQGFSDHPGDAMAFRCWKLARQQNDLQQRSRLIAQGLKFAHSQTARQQIEQLLTDFTVVANRPAPRWPLYRLESDEELPRLIPVVGELPLTLEDLKAVPLTDEIEPFRMVKFSGSGAWVPVPGWKVVLGAEDPIAILAKSDHLPNPLPGKVEEVLVIIDRSQREWEADSYFLVEESEQLELKWFEEAVEIPVLGRVILVMRPKRILDEDQVKNIWQFED